jgi:hypothetical protein
LPARPGSKFNIDFGVAQAAGRILPTVNLKARHQFALGVSYGFQSSFESSAYSFNRPKKPELKLGTKRRCFVPNFSSGFFLRREMLTLNSKSH